MLSRDKQLPVTTVTVEETWNRLPNHKCDTATWLQKIFAISIPDLSRVWLCKGSGAYTGRFLKQMFGCCVQA